MCEQEKLADNLVASSDCDHPLPQKERDDSLKKRQEWVKLAKERKNSGWSKEV